MSDDVFDDDVFDDDDDVNACRAICDEYATVKRRVENQMRLGLGSLQEVTGDVERMDELSLMLVDLVYPLIERFLGGGDRDVTA